MRLVFTIIPLLYHQSDERKKTVINSFHGLSYPHAASPPCARQQFSAPPRIILLALKCLVANGGTRNTRNRGEGADDSPFYENDGGTGADGTPGNRWEYWYPGFNDRQYRNGPLVHEEERYSSFYDGPRNVSGARIKFQVFLAVVNHGSNFLDFVGEDRAFGKLIGFDWVAEVNQSGETRITRPTQVNPRGKKEGDNGVHTALRQSGFTGWTTLNDFELVPEPASMLALAIGLTGLALRRRRHAS